MDTESYDSWLGFLRRIRDRGVEGVMLVTSGAHEVLRRAIQETFQGAAWQRCVVHIIRYCSSSAVQDILARADERGVGWDDVAPLTDDDARRLVRGNPGKGGAAFAAIDYERIDQEMARDRTMTLSRPGDLLSHCKRRSYLASRDCGGNPGPNRDRGSAACSAKSREGSR